jgi:hypothetical protein
LQAVSAAATAQSPVITLHTFIMPGILTTTAGQVNHPQALKPNLLLRQLKIDVLSVLVVTDKVDFGEVSEANETQKPADAGGISIARGVSPSK